MLPSLPHLMNAAHCELTQTSHLLAPFAMCKMLITFKCFEFSEEIKVGNRKLLCWVAIILYFPHDSN